LLSPELLERAGRFLDLYMALPDPGPVEAEIHLLAAQGRHESGLLGGWGAHTRGAYHVHQGQGTHPRMLRLPEVRENCRLLERILDGLCGHGQARAGGGQ
jgi:thioesterase domain-containing protein